MSGIRDSFADKVIEARKRELKKPSNLIWLAAILSVTIVIVVWSVPSADRKDAAIGIAQTLFGTGHFWCLVVIAILSVLLVASIVSCWFLARISKIEKSNFDKLISKGD